MKNEVEIQHGEFAGEPVEVPAMRVSEEVIARQRLRAVLDVVQRYLPPGGVSAHNAMSEIIGLVDPWPLTAAPSPITDAAAGGGVVEVLKAVLATLCAQFPKEQADAMEVVQMARAALSSQEGKL
jgi:hypothetical protein